MARLRRTRTPGASGAWTGRRPGAREGRASGLHRRPSPPPSARRQRLAVGAIWLLGLAALGLVLVLQARLDERRQAQLAVATLRTQMGALPRIALGLDGRPAGAGTQAALAAAERRVVATARSLDRLAGNPDDARLVLREARPLLAVLARANALARSGRLPAATLTLGRALRPGAAGRRLDDTFGAIGARYGRQAAAARAQADVGSALAIVLLLLGFSLTLRRASCLARDKHALLEQTRLDALTDELTGLWNRRKLFADLDELTRRPAGAEPALLGVLDLDGFKVYNDRFGHPAGDALLARMGEALRAALAADGAAYRLGGDEFCVVAHGPDAAAVLERARTTLAERVGGPDVGCSLGTAWIAEDGATPDALLRTADARLYEDKRASRAAPAPVAARVAFAPS